MEIKFRAWDRNEKYMYSTAIPFYRNGKMEFIINDWQGAGYDYSEIEVLAYDAVHIYEENPYRVMQYTGLKDDMNREIYEGDILEYLDGEYSFRAIIERDYHTWYLKGFSPYDNYSINDFVDNGRTNLKIIGNIYENPELLE